MAYPLVVIAFMQIVVGGTVYLRTDSQLSTLSAQLQTNPAAFKVEETARMIAVMKNFSIYKTIEMLLLITGIGIIAFLQRYDVAAGIGVGLVLQSALHWRWTYLLRSEELSTCQQYKDLQIEFSMNLF
jgi:hypothetical protein